MIITFKQLEFLLHEETKRANPITIIGFTDARPRKTGNPHKSIWKLNTVNGFVGNDYEKSVNRQRIRENKQDDFEVGTNWGHQAYPDALGVIEHKGKKYVQMKVEKTRSPRYFNENYKELDQDDIAPFLKEGNKNGKQNLEKEVVIRRYMFESILKVRVNKKEYIIKENQHKVERLGI